MRDFITKVDNTAPADSGILKAEEDNVRFEEMENFVTSTGIVLDAFNGPDLDKAMLAQASARYASGGIYYQDESTTENQHVLSSPLAFIMPKAYFEGMLVRFVPGATNTGNSTINVNSVGTKPIKLYDGSGLTGGELASGKITELYYKADSGDDGEFLILPWALPQDGGGGGEANTGVNVGTGVGLYKEKNGVELRFRKITGVNGISVSVEGDDVQLDAAGVSGSILPIYPHVLTPSKTLIVNDNGGGVVEVAAAQSFVHRGLSLVSTDDYTSGQRQFTTAADKTYHIRWTNGGGFAIQDMDGLTETDAAYDSDFDDMLVARVVTDGSNVPTITSLINKNNHSLKTKLEGLTPTLSGQNGAFCNFDVTLNFARTPDSRAFVERRGYSRGNDDHDLVVTYDEDNRYKCKGNYRYDYATSMDVVVTSTMLGG